MRAEKFSLEIEPYSVSFLQLSELITFRKNNFKAEWIFSTIDHISEVDLSNNGIVTYSEQQVNSAACFQKAGKEYVLTLCS